VARLAAQYQERTGVDERLSGKSPGKSWKFPWRLAAICHDWSRHRHGVLVQLPLRRRRLPSLKGE